MLDAAVVLEIRRFLAAGELSQREIARRFGVSRGTVYLVACGKRGLRTHRGPRTPPRGGTMPTLAVRCPGCGGMVFAPCMLCRVRERRRRLQDDDGPRSDGDDHRAA